MLASEKMPLVCIWAFPTILGLTCPIAMDPPTFLPDYVGAILSSPFASPAASMLVDTVVRLWRLALILRA